MSGMRSASTSRRPRLSSPSSRVTSPAGSAMAEPAGEVTRLLGELSRGRREVEADLIPLIYHELRRLAAAQMKRERPCHTLQPTAHDVDRPPMGRIDLAKPQADVR